MKLEFKFYNHFKRYYWYIAFIPELEIGYTEIENGFMYNATISWLFWDIDINLVKEEVSLLDGVKDPYYVGHD